VTLGKAQLLPGVLVDGAVAQLLIEFSFQDFLKPEHGALLRGITGFQGGFQGEIGALGGLARGELGHET